MNKTCYLVAHIDSTKSPPVIAYLATYSEGAGTVTCDLHQEFPLDLFQTEGSNYGEARQRMMDELRDPRCHLTSCGEGLKALVDDLLRRED